MVNLSGTKRILPTPPGSGPRRTFDTEIDLSARKANNDNAGSGSSAVFGLRQIILLGWASPIPNRRSIFVMIHLLMSLSRHTHNHMRGIFLGLVFALTVLQPVFAQEPGTEKIRLNQVGFYPAGPKTAVVLSEKVVSFTVRDSHGKSVHTGQSKAPAKSALSGKFYATLDFSDVRKPGEYTIQVAGIGSSYPFEIRANVHHQLARAAIKNYYFQRLSIPLERKHAGEWRRPAGHPDNVVLIHPSAATATRPAEAIISSPKGWYDAGDYNKYIVNSGITMGTMLSAYEDYPEYYDSLDLHIPESGNALPDLLDELLWNLRWMLTMQDPGDGGVYHKLTNPKFDGMVMPHEAKDRRYVVQKSTAATLDFSAVMAQASRVFSRFEVSLPGLADSCLEASRYAYEWAEKNPSVLYDQEKLNQRFDPDISTGAYGDSRLKDEFSWAAGELYATTGEPRYFSDVREHYDSSMSVPSWGNVRMCGYYTLIRLAERLPEEGRQLAGELKPLLISFATRMIAQKAGSPFESVMGSSKKDFIWGSNAVAANQAIVLLNAYKISQDKTYLTNAVHNLDYLLGRNGTGYSFVTGFGDKRVMHPHHRPSEADGVVDPIPGMLSGGPNPSMQDKCHYTSSFPDEAFTDDVCSYASNEIAINWNAPLVYLTGALEFLYGSERMTSAPKK